MRAAGRRRGGGSAWKWVGLAGLAGVAATGVVVARSERQRRAYEPEDVRARLHERAAAAGAAAQEPTPEAEAPPAAGPVRRRWQALRARMKR